MVQQQVNTVLCSIKRFVLLFTLLWVGMGAAWAQENSAEPSRLLNLQVLKGHLEKNDSVSLTLRQALEMALEKNPSIDGAKAGVDMARHKYQTSLAQMLPDLSLTYEISNYEGAVQTFGSQVIDVLRNTYQPQLVFKFPVFQGGRRFFQARADKKLYQGEKENSRNTTHQVLKSTALAYYGLQSTLESLALAQKQFEEIQTLLDNNKARMEAGVGTRLDVLQSEAQLAKARLGVLSALSGVEKSAISLNELLALPAFADAVSADNIEHAVLAPLVPAAYKASDLMALAKAHRPDLLALQKQVQSVKSLRQMAWSTVLPEIAIQARTGGVGASFAGIKSYDQTSASVGFNFKNLGVPALTLYKQESAHLDLLESQVRSLHNRIQSEIEKSILDSLTAQEQVLAATAQLEASRQAKEDALDRLNAGVGRNIDVLDAETHLAEARASVNQAKLAFYTAQVSLIDALGLTTIDTLTQGIKAP